MYGNYYQPYVPQQSRMQLIRVSGMDGARAYQMPANSSVALFDSNNDVMYVKTTDGAGFPTVRAFQFKPLQTSAPEAPDYVTRKQFNELKEMINSGKQFVQRKQQQQPRQQHD